MNISCLTSDSTKTITRSRFRARNLIINYNRKYLPCNVATLPLGEKNVSSCLCHTLPPAHSWIITGN